MRITLHTMLRTETCTMIQLQRFIEDLMWFAATVDVPLNELLACWHEQWEEAPHA